MAFTLPSERWGGGVADVRPDPAGVVWGAVWRIDEREGAVLDRQEGVHHSPPRYRRLQVSVATPHGAQLACFAYQVVTPAAEHIAPSASYLQTMLAGARAAGLSADYVAGIQAIALSGG